MNRVKRLAAVVMAAAVVTIGMSAPATADHTEDDFIQLNLYALDGDTWNESISRSVCISGDITEALGPSQEDNAVDAMNLEMFEKWENLTDLNEIFDVEDSGADFPCGDFDFTGDFEDAGGTLTNATFQNFCEDIPDSRRSSIQSDWVTGTPLDNYAAYAFVCDRDNNDRTDYFVINVNRGILVDTGDFSFHYDCFSDPNDIRYDFCGVMVHEAGHAIGYDKHMTGACAHAWGTWSTMCAGDYGYFKVAAANQAGTAARSPETHDTGEVNQAYA